MRVTDLAERLDQWIGRHNREAPKEGAPLLRRCRIRLLGQMALFEIAPPLTLRATDDVDAIIDADYAVRERLELLLDAEGLALDRLAHEVWMPAETVYNRAYVGANVVLEVADLESVLISKALKAPKKNARLLTEYLAQGPSARFMGLAAKYELDLEQFV